MRSRKTPLRVRKFISRHIKKHYVEYGYPLSRAKAAAYSEARKKYPRYKYLLRR